MHYCKDATNHYAEGALGALAMKWVRILHACTVYGMLNNVLPVRLFYPGARRACLPQGFGCTLLHL